MIEFNFTLCDENIRELHFYLALHDAKIQTKMLTLSISFSVLAVILAILLFRLTWGALLCGIIGVVLVFALFPKIYWNTVSKRIEKIVAQKAIQYHQTSVTFGDTMKIQDGNEKYTINYKDVLAFDFTKNNCLIFYERHGTKSTLVLPNEVIGERLAEFCEFLSGVIKDAKG